MLAWYRQRLKDQIPGLICKWEGKLGVKVAAWGVKRMKTRWGTCSVDARRIWINLELTKNSVYCLEYILVHEMLHLLERHHNDRFTSLMTHFLPPWRQYRTALNSAPLGDETWSY